MVALIRTVICLIQGMLNQLGSTLADATVVLDECIDGHEFRPLLLSPVSILFDGQLVLVVSQVSHLGVGLLSREYHLWTRDFSRSGLC